ncbi:group II intron reverse transcriptase/maturase [Streptomyces sp. NPDC049541]|uniref:group II intron reverse transcriptase/maturase n=1 Tax=Streptomyces sp. NPDC049541 TaxID=3365594 RepID=UPI0037BC56ED
MFRGKPAKRKALINSGDHTIVATFGAVHRGIVQYYLLARDVFRLHRLQWVMETSMLKTLAAKHRSSAAKMAAKHKGPYARAAASAHWTSLFSHASTTSLYGKVLPYTGMHLTSCSHHSFRTARSVPPAQPGRLRRTH